MKKIQIANQIATIQKLKMVRFYHLFGVDGPMCGILAYYQDKTINLCNADEHFYALFDRIAEVYALEKNEAVIQMDEETRQIMERACAFAEDAYAEMLSDYEESGTPVVLPKAFSHVYLLPIVKYVIDTLYNSRGSTISFEERYREWFGKGMFEGMLGERRMRFPYRITAQNGERYEMEVRDVLNDGNVLKVEIHHGSGGIAISYYDSFFFYAGSLYCRMTRQGVRLSHVLEERGKELLAFDKYISQKESVMPTQSVRKLIGVLAEEWKAYELPWREMVFQAQSEAKEYRILFSEGNGIKISHCACFRNLAKGEEASVLFGEYSLRLYEREDVTELHLLDMDEPRSGRYKESYAGRYYVKKWVGEGEDGIHG